VTKPDFTYLDAPIWFDPQTRRITTTVDHVAPELRAFIEGLYPTREATAEASAETNTSAAEMATEALMMALSVAAVRVRELGRA
jgi:hypothetical protein